MAIAENNEAENGDDRDEWLPIVVICFVGELPQESPERREESESHEKQNGFEYEPILNSELNDAVDESLRADSTSF